jgi:uncharacterized protein
MSLEIINIPRLTKMPDRTETVRFREFIPDLETLMPVQGELKVTHQGNYLEVSGRAETIVTLTCHRCLQQYNHRLKIAPSELIWLEASEDPEALEPVEREVPLEDLVENLHPEGDFNPQTWIYEQLCLAIPPRQLCDANCGGIPVSDADTDETPTDRRWAALEALKGQLPG